jgi:hypothetical protein
LKISRRRSVLLILAVSLIPVSIVIAQTLLAATTTNTVSVGNTLSVSGMWVEANAPLGGIVPLTTCTLSSGTNQGGTWTCPQSAIPSTMFANMNITYGTNIESDKAGEVPSVTSTTSPTYSGLTMKTYWQLHGASPPAWTLGVPTMTAGTSYDFIVVYYVNGASSGGSFSLTTNINAQ